MFAWGEITNSISQGFAHFVGAARPVFAERRTLSPCGLCWAHLDSILKGIAVLTSPSCPADDSPDRSRSSIISVSIGWFIDLMNGCCKAAVLTNAIGVFTGGAPKDLIKSQVAWCLPYQKAWNCTDGGSVLAGTLPSAPASHYPEGAELGP